MAPWRYLPAIVFDLATIAWPTAVGIVAFHERFTILPTTDGSPRFSPAEQARINDIDQIFNRGIRLGDNIFTLSGSGWWLTMFVLVVATIVVFIGVPAVMGQRTIGQRLLGMTASASSKQAATMIDVAAPLDHYDSTTATEPSFGLSTAPPVSSDEVMDMAAIDEADDEMGHADDAVDTVPEEQPMASEELDDETTEIDVTEDAGSIDVANPDVDISDSAPWRQVTLADENDYLQWERDHGRAAAAPASTATLTQTAEAGVQATTDTLLMPDRETNGITVDSPEWSADWNAWMFWDPKSRRWYKHDTDNNRWSPVS